MASYNLPKYDIQNFERLVFNILESEKTLYSPLEIQLIENKPKDDKQSSQTRNKIKVLWQGREFLFQLEIKSRSAPKIVQEAFLRFKNLPISEQKNILLVVPYLTSTIQEMAKHEIISCIDLSGNYLIQHHELLAMRLDQKNRFPESTPIKKIFSGNSSQVGRLLLTEKRIYTSVNEVFEVMNRLGGRLSLSAISKVLSRLQDELIIEKSNRCIRLLQPEKLLNRLTEEYIQPPLLSTIKLNIPGKTKEIYHILADDLSKKTWMLSGESSIGRYAITTAPSILRIYTSQAGNLSKYEDSRFYNVILETINEPFIYFDRQITKRDRIYWASRLQTYFELTRMDKREREISTGIRDAILKEF